MQEPDGFREFVLTRSPALKRAAWLLTGEHAAAEDLVQASLARTWPRWGALARTSSAEAYVRRVMFTTYVNWTKRRWRGEVPSAQPPEVAEANDDIVAAEARADVRAALAELTPRQRAVVVLRYFEDLSEAQTAEALGCSVGTVKSQTSKALARLREHPWHTVETSEDDRT
jgi:RNA polymerase sigma-70 factor (sigma-E family)